MLADRGIMVSTGAACSGGGKTTHRVLVSMGYSEKEAAHTIRLSWGKTTPPSDITGCVEALRKIVEPIQTTRTR